MEAVLGFRSVRCRVSSAFFTGAPVAMFVTCPSIPPRSSGFVRFACGALAWLCCAHSAAATNKPGRRIFIGVLRPICDKEYHRENLGGRAILPAAGFQPAQASAARPRCHEGRHTRFVFEKEGPVAKPAPQRTRRRIGRDQASMRMFLNLVVALPPESSPNSFLLPRPRKAGRNKSAVQC